MVATLAKVHKTTPDFHSKVGRFYLVISVFLLVVVVLVTLVKNRNRRLLGSLDATDHLRLDTVRASDVDQTTCSLLAIDVHLQAMTHIEYAEHLAPRGLALLLNGAEQNGGGEEIVFDYVQIINEMQNLGLRTATAMDHTLDIAAILLQRLTHNGQIGTCGRQHELTQIGSASCRERV